MRLWLFALAGCGRVGFSDPTAADAPRIGDAATDAPTQSVAPPPYVSGSRLRAVAWHVGGATQFARWYDHTLGASCVGQDTTAGRRCVPTEAPRLDLFADGACTVPLYGSQVCLDGDARILTHTGGGVVSGYLDQTPFTATYYVTNGASCDAVSGPWPYPLYTAGATHDASELPALAPQETTVGPVQLEEEVSDDGARRVLGFADPATGQACHLDAAAPGTAACVPDATPATDAVFADPACTEPAYVLPKDPPPAWVVLAPSDACSDARTYLPVTGASIGYLPLGGSCASLNLAPGYGGFAVGAARARASFPTGELVARGSGAVQELAWVSGALDIVVGAWDPSLSIECYFGPSTAQHSRCYPQTAVSFAHSWSPDATCGSTQWQAASCRPPQYVPFAIAGSACDFTGDTAGAIDESTATPYTGTNTTCAPVAAPAGTTFTKWDGGAVPSAAFQRADSVLE